MRTSTIYSTFPGIMKHIMDTFAHPMNCQEEGESMG